MKVSRTKLRRATRLATAALITIVVTLTVVQFTKIIARNVAMVRSLHQIQADEKALRLRKRQQERELNRLSDPMGSIPEIHDRLHLTTSHEAIIYLKQARPPKP